MCRSGPSSVSGQGHFYLSFVFDVIVVTKTSFYTFLVTIKMLGCSNYLQAQQTSMTANGPLTVTWEPWVERLLLRQFICCHHRLLTNITLRPVVKWPGDSLERCSPENFKLLCFNASRPWNICAPGRHFSPPVILVIGLNTMRFIKPIRGIRGLRYVCRKV